MSLPASEAFTGTGALSGAWTVQSGTVERNSDKADFAGSFSYAFWNADAFANDQKSQANLGTSGIPGTQQYAGVTVRASGSDNQVFLYAGATDMFLYQTVAGAGSLLATFAGESSPWGELYRLECEGTTYRCYREGVQMGSDTVDASLTSGSCGIGGNDTGATTLDDWLGNDFVAGGGIVVPVLTQLMRRRRG